MIDPRDADSRLLETLQRLLAIQAPELRPALTEACSLVNDVLSGDKVDVFLYEVATDSLVAMGTSETPMGHREHEIGMDRLPLANGGPMVRVFRSGEPYLTGRADQDPDQLRGTAEGLGVRSEMGVPLDVQGERRGVISAVSTAPDAFTERDLRFLQTVAHLIGMVTHRAELAEQAARQAARQGRRQAAEELARLSRREREVAVHLAEGLTNAEIARRLSIVEGTVANHVEHILRKLNLRGRTQVAIWAVEHGLYRLGQEEHEPEA
ncbi:MAG: LuxR C-terminal-related transcriptional regulator [Chloroflexota bacterium]|nr:LuxR C-terminal-related transcriptional regulator [Chloroflexota bacterium]